MSKENDLVCDNCGRGDRLYPPDDDCPEWACERCGSECDVVPHESDIAKDSRAYWAKNSAELGYIYD